MQIKTPTGTLDRELDIQSYLQSTAPEIVASTQTVVQTAIRVDLERYLREWCKRNPDKDASGAIDDWYPGKKVSKPPKPVTTALRRQLEKLSPEVRAQLLKELA